MSNFNNNSTFQQVLSYTNPQLYTGKEWYIGFQAFDPVIGKLKRKRIKLNRIDKIGERRKYANDLLKRITQQLQQGWNPWIEQSDGKGHYTFKEVCEHYGRFIDKMYADGNYRKETYTGYVSYLRNLVKWNASRLVPITYIYQFNREFLIEFLEYIYIERDNTAQTRDNYLTFLRVFSSFLVQHSYAKTKPTEDISTFSKRVKKKQRKVISDLDIRRLHDHLIDTNKHFLLACYILHYCFIRPKEMSKIRLYHFNIKKSTIFIPGEISKNGSDATITLPKKVLYLMLELEVFDKPNDYYLFSDGFRPGRKYRSEKAFRDYWQKIRKELNFPDHYKFYSLKDTGITSMLREYDTITVRDQARHADILMTDTYTPHDIQTANQLLIRHQGVF